MQGSFLPTETTLALQILATTVSLDKVVIISTDRESSLVVLVKDMIICTALSDSAPTVDTFRESSLTILVLLVSAGWF